jgi:putative nucleotidyltransferase with HDIG domain
LEGQPANPVYRWQHTLRVTHYGRQIAEAEGADIELVVAACLLHDSEKYSDGQDGVDERGHGRAAAQTVRPFLAQIGYSPEQVDNICYSVAVHVDGEAGYEHEHTLEARVVSDADNVDRFGAYRVMLWCVDDMRNYDALIAKLTARVQRLEDYRARQVLETQTGNHLFAGQLDLQIDFFQKLIAEHAITRLPE